MSLFPGFMMPQANDASVQYLAQILGHQVVDDILGVSSATGLDTHIFSRMMDLFNHLLLGGGLLIFAILLFIGTMNSAADGQFLGKKWDSTWTPVRLVFGILLIVPLNTGYCMGQYIILYAIFLGINLATVMWQEVINDVFNDQDTPPPPTYLTADIQEALAEGLNNLAVPLIVKQSGIANSNQTGSVIVINIPPTTYSVSSATIPSGVISAMSSDLGGSSGLCSGLFSASNFVQSCQKALSAVLSGENNPGYDDSISGAESSVAIGSNILSPLPASGVTDPWYGAYATGIPLKPWTPDGNVSVYGAYVYNLPNASFSSSASGGVCGGSNQPACVVVGQGITNASADLANVVNNAVTGPAAAVTPGVNGLLKPQDAQNLLAVCNAPANTGTNNSIVTVNGSLTPCDIQPAIQDIITAARGYAQALALANAASGSDPNGSNPPCQSASKPGEYSFCSLTNSASPQGQQAALADNTYKYQDASGNWHIGYNLNDYWIPDINSQQYFDLQLNNSWWMSGSSYLVIDNAMNQSMSWMAQAIQMELSVFQQSSSGQGQGSSHPNYQCTGAAHFTPDVNPADLGNFVTGEFCLNYGVQVMQYSIEAKNQAGSAGSLTSSGDRGWTANCTTYQPTISGVPVDYYSCGLDQARASQQVVRNIPYAQDNIGVSNWSSLIAPYAPPSGGVSIGGFFVDTSATPMFYQQLESVPAALQGPIAVLLTLAGQTQQAGYIKLYPYLVTLLNTLQYNGALSQGPVASSLPVNQAISFIFNQLIGGHSGIGNANSAQGAADSINSVMQQVYNLGIVDANKGVINAQFSLIQQAQTAGISMIMACVSSMDAVFSTYTATLQNMVNTVNQMTSGTQSMDNMAKLAGFIPIFGPILSADTQNDFRTLQLEVMTTVTTTMTSISVQLMWLPLFMFIMTSLFVAGVQFSVLVPLMPYILFWGGEIAWLIGVLEAVVAAPLIMLGLAHPGGNDYLGHSAPAVRMLIGVMFRPVLMVIGMMVGIMLTYIVITFSAQGFHIVAAGILNAVPSSESTVQGIMACLMLFIYATFLVMAFEKCFSTIYIFPEKVVEYIGGVAAKGGEAELQRMSQATDKTAQGAAQAGGDTMNKGLQAKQDQAKGATQISEKTAQTGFEDATATGKGRREALGEGVAMASKMIDFMG